MVWRTKLEFIVLLGPRFSLLSAVIEEQSLYKSSFISSKPTTKPYHIQINLASYQLSALTTTSNVFIELFQFWHPPSSSFPMSIPTSPSTAREQAIPSGETSSAQSPSHATSNKNHVVVGSTSTACQKRRFLLFIKILFKSLEQACEFETRDRAREIVSDCTRRNRLEDPAFTPLIDVIDQRLRRYVGEAHWRRAHMYMHHYLMTRSVEDPRITTSSQTRRQQTMVSVLISPQQTELQTTTMRRL